MNTIEFLSGEPACRIPLNDEFVKLVEASAKKNMEKLSKVYLQLEQDQWYFNKILGCPCVSIGCTYNIVEFIRQMNLPE